MKIPSTWAVLKPSVSRSVLALPHCADRDKYIISVYQYLNLCLCDLPANSIVFEPRLKLPLTASCCACLVLSLCWQFLKSFKRGLLISPHHVYYDRKDSKGCGVCRILLSYILLEDHIRRKPGCLQYAFRSQRFLHIRKPRLEAPMQCV